MKLFLYAVPFLASLLCAADVKYSISTLAGSRPLGDGGAATSALLGSFLNGVSVDEVGNLYVADVLLSPCEASGCERDDYYGSGKRYA